MIEHEYYIMSTTAIKKNSFSSIDYSAFKIRMKCTLKMQANLFVHTNRSMILK